jgi:DNA-directed RNA polymerase beta' subunit
MVNEVLFVSTIPIIPPDLRPITSGNGSTMFVDETNTIYRLIINLINHINDCADPDGKFVTQNEDGSYSIQEEETYLPPCDKMASLQQYYFTLHDMILKKLSSKTGIMRKYILGKRVDYSGRAVIVPDASLNINEIDVSFYIIKEIFKPAILPKFALMIGVSELEALNSCYDSPIYEDMLFELCKQYKGTVAILNRQPTLHRPSILAFFIRDVIRDWVIAISPSATEPFNADFDGDQMAIYCPIGGAAYNEALSLMPQENLYLPSNGEIAFEFKEDLVLGLYQLSLTEDGKKKIYDVLPEKVHQFYNFHQ